PRRKTFAYRALNYPTASVRDRAQELLGFDTGRCFRHARRSRAVPVNSLLTPVEQGYYYTLLSLVALQMVFELGFSFVILQLAAHETVHLTLHPDGRIEGDRAAHLRLASVLKKPVRWYLVAGAVMLATLLPAGSLFFSTRAHGGDMVRWH